MKTSQHKKQNPVAKHEKEIAQTCYKESKTSSLMLLQKAAILWAVQWYGDMVYNVLLDAITYARDASVHFGRRLFIRAWARDAYTNVNPKQTFILNNSRSNTSNMII